MPQCFLFPSWLPERASWEWQTREEIPTPAGTPARTPAHTPADLPPLSFTPQPSAQDVIGRNDSDTRNQKPLGAWGVSLGQIRIPYKRDCAPAGMTMSVCRDNGARGRGPDHRL